MCYNNKNVEDEVKLEEYKSLFYYICDDFIDEKEVSIFRTKTDYLMFCVEKKGEDYVVSDSNTIEKVRAKYIEKYTGIYKRASSDLPSILGGIDMSSHSRHRDYKVFPTTLIKPNDAFKYQISVQNGQEFVAMDCYKMSGSVKFEYNDKVYAIPYEYSVPETRVEIDKWVFLEGKREKLENALNERISFYLSMGYDPDKLAKHFSILQPIDVFFAPLVEHAQGFAVAYNGNQMLVDIENKNDHIANTIAHELNHLIAKHINENGNDVSGICIGDSQLNGISEGLTEWFANENNDIGGKTLAYNELVQMAYNLFEDKKDVFGFYIKGDFEGISKFTAKKYNTTVDEVKQFFFQLEAYYTQNYDLKVRNETPYNYAEQTVKQIVKSYSKIILNRHFKSNVRDLLKLPNSYYKDFSAISNLTAFNKKYLTFPFVKAKEEFFIDLIESGQLKKNGNDWILNGAKGKISNAEFTNLCKHFSVSKKMIEEHKKIKTFDAYKIINDKGFTPYRFNDYLTLGMTDEAFQNEIFNVLFTDKKVSDENKILLLGVWNRRQLNNFVMNKVLSSMIEAKKLQQKDKSFVYGLKQKVLKNFLNKCDNKSLTFLEINAIENTNFYNFLIREKKERGRVRKKEAKKEKIIDITR